MKYTAHIINPAPVKKKPRRASRKRSKKAGSHSKNPGKGIAMATRRKTVRRRKTRRARKNPVATFNVNGSPKRRRAPVYRLNGYKKRTRRHRRNPDGSALSVSMDPLKVDNAIKYAIGIGGGIFAPPIITNMLGFTGNAKYLTQLAIGAAGYMLGKRMGQGKAGLAFFISAAAVTGLEFSMDYGLMQGAHTLLGVPYRPANGMVMNGMVPYRRLNGIVPYPRLNGIVPNNRSTSMQSSPAVSGFDKGVY